MEIDKKQLIIILLILYLFILLIEFYQIHQISEHNPVQFVVVSPKHKNLKNIHNFTKFMP